MSEETVQIKRMEDELKSLKTLCIVLDRHDDEACRRILNYLWDRYVPVKDVQPE